MQIVHMFGCIAMWWAVLLLINAVCFWVRGQDNRASKGFAHSALIGSLGIMLMYL